MNLLTLTLFTLLPLSLGAGPPPKPPTPKFPTHTFLYTLNITGGETYPVGPGPYGLRLVVPILGGSFSGPLLRGTVLPVGGEWGVLDLSHASTNQSLSAFHIDVRQTLKTDDGAYIQVFESGASQPPDGRDALVTMRFDTGSDKYYWINNVVGVGVLRTVGDGSQGRISIDCWALGLPPA